jgi:hypothetical protein
MNDLTIDKVILIYTWSMPQKEHSALLSIVEKIPRLKAISIPSYFFENVCNFERKWFGKKDNLDFSSDQFHDLNENSHYPEIFKNKHFQFQFDRINQEILISSYYAELFSLLLDMLNPSLIFFGHDAFIMESAFIKSAKNRKIPTLSFVHGTLRVKDSLRRILGDSDIKLVKCNKDIEWINSYEIDRGKLIKIGSLEHEVAYKNYLKNSQKKIQKNNKNKKKIRLGLRSNNPLVVMCTVEISSDLINTVADPVKHRQALRDFLSLVKSRQDLQFIIKSHPGGGDYYEIYREMFNLRLPNLIFNQDYTLAEVLEACDIFFMINSCTTAAVEAMLNQVPVIFFDNAIYKIDDCQDNLCDTGITRVETMAELELAIDNIIKIPEIKKVALHEADSQLKILFGYEDAYPSKSLSDLIKSLLRNQLNSVNVELTGKKRFQYFLDANENFASEKHELVSRNYNCFAIMFCFATLAGSYNLNVASLSKIISICISDKKQIDQSYCDLKWELFEAYIEGYNFASDKGVSLNWVGILWLCILNLNKFISSQNKFRSHVFRCIINQLVGHEALSFAKNIYLYCKR